MYNMGKKLEKIKVRNSCQSSKSSVYSEINAKTEIFWKLGLQCLQATVLIDSQKAISEKC